MVGASCASCPTATTAGFVPGRVIDLPVQRPTSCQFGGPDLSVLFVTTARQKLTPQELATQPLAGALLALDVGVKGVAEARYVG